MKVYYLVFQTIYPDQSQFVSPLLPHPAFRSAHPIDAFSFRNLAGKNITSLVLVGVFFASVRVSC